MYMRKIAGRLTVTLGMLCTDRSALDHHPFGVANGNAGVLNFLEDLSNVQ